MSDHVRKWFDTLSDHFPEVIFVSVLVPRVWDCDSEAEPDMHQIRPPHVTYGGVFVYAAPAPRYLYSATALACMTLARKTES